MTCISLPKSPGATIRSRTARTLIRGARLVTAVGLIGGMLAVPAAGRVLARDVPGAQAVSAYGGTAAWSELDRSGERYVLTTWRAGKTRRVRVAPNDRPFDVDLGPGPNGETVAVYSRCTRPDAFIDPRFDAPNWTVSRGCRIYEADLRTGRERRLRSTHVAGGSEYLPTVWRRNIAFARLRGTSGVADVVVQRRTGETLRRVPGGPPGEFAKGPPDVALTPGPLSLDLRGEALAYVWTYGVANCPRGTAEVDVAGYSEIRVLGSDRRPILVDRTCNFTERRSSVVGATWAGSSLAYVLNDLERGIGIVMRARAPFASPTPARVPPLPAYVGSMSAAGRWLYARASPMRRAGDIIRRPSWR